VITPSHPQFEQAQKHYANVVEEEDEAKRLLDIIQAPAREEIESITEFEYGELEEFAT